MDCKNCERPLQGAQRYCALCGAKVIHNRLTFKNLWLDFGERFLNYDNTFLKTFAHLFTKPEEVVNGYISGVRKKYMNPLNFMGIALMVSGVLTFIIQKLYLEDIKMDVFNTGADKKVFRQIFETALDFQAFVFVILIPMLALSSWLLLNRQRHIFSEHLVAHIYIQANYTIATFPISIIILAIEPSTYTSYGLINLLFMLLYSLYVLKRITSFGIGNYLWRALVFIIFFFVQYVVISNAIIFLLIFMGVMSLDDFRPE